MTPEEMSFAYSRLLLENTQLRYLVRTSNTELDKARSQAEYWRFTYERLQDLAHQQIATAKAAISRRGPDWKTLHSLSSEVARLWSCLVDAVTLLAMTTEDINTHTEGNYAEALAIEVDARLEHARELLKETP